MHVITKADYDHRAMTYAGAVYEDGAVLAESLRPHGAWRHSEKRPVPDNGRKIQKAVYAGRFFYHFGHFLIETLPNLFMVKGIGAVILHPWPETLDWKVLTVPYIKFSIEALDMSPQRIIFAKEQLRVDDLLVIPANHVIGGRPLPGIRAAYQRIAAYAGSRSNIDTYDNIYFSRRQFTGKARPISNEIEVEKLFEAKGFKVYFPEKMPFQDQVKLAAKATVVAGIDGSALHLCAFMNGGRCIVLNTRARAPAIEALNAIAGVETVWIDGAGTAVGTDRIIVLDIPSVEQAIASIIQ